METSNCLPRERTNPVRDGIFTEGISWSYTVYLPIRHHSDLGTVNSRTPCLCAASSFCSHVLTLQNPLICLLLITTIIIIIMSWFTWFPLGFSMKGLFTWCWEKREHNSQDENFFFLLIYHVFHNKMLRLFPVSISAPDMWLPRGVRRDLGSDRSVTTVIVTSCHALCKTP